MIYSENEYFHKHQWGALEEILSDWKKGAISTDECIIYGCHVLEIEEPSNNNKKMLKFLPTKYDLCKISIEEGPYFFVFYLYKLINSAGSKARNEFLKSDWSDQEFIDEYINNNEFIKIINNMEQQTLNGQKYIHYCEAIEKATKLAVIHFDTLIYKHLLAHVGILKYIEIIQKFEKKYHLECHENDGRYICGTIEIRELFDNLNQKYNQNFSTIPNNKQRKRRLINTINYYYYCLSRYNELKDK